MSGPLADAGYPLEISARFTIPSGLTAEHLPDSSVMRLLLMGTDVVAASRPVTPVQLAHACLELGFDSVIPGSWGDELVAAACLQELSRLRDRDPVHTGPVVLATCPHVSSRVLSTGEELRDLLVPLAPPPVALARYLRALAGDQPIHLTWGGECPAAGDAAVDARLSSEELMATLKTAGIDPAVMPLEFADVLPPDRRRHLSQPGGAPTHAALAAAPGGWKLADVGDRELPTALAELLLSDDPLVVDIAPRVGCRCAGSSGDCGSEARDALTLLEPPRSATPVVDHSIVFDTTYPLPEASPAPRESPAGGPAAFPAPFGSAPAASADTTPDGDTSAASEPSPRHRPSPTRSIVGATPTTRTPEGRMLPRAYVSRRRHTPRTGQVQRQEGDAPQQDVETALPEPRLYGGHSGPLGRLTRTDREPLKHSPAAARPASSSTPDAAGFTRTQLVLLFFATAIAGALLGTLLGGILRG